MVLLHETTTLNVLIKVGVLFSVVILRKVTTLSVLISGGVLVSGNNPWPHFSGNFTLNATILSILLKGGVLISAVVCVHFLNNWYPNWCPDWWKTVPIFATKIQASSTAVFSFCRACIGSKFEHIDLSHPASLCVFLLLEVSSYPTWSFPWPHDPGHSRVIHTTSGGNFFYLQRMISLHLGHPFTAYYKQLAGAF